MQNQLVVMAAEGAVTIETEKKYLLRGVPEGVGLCMADLVQGYLDMQNSGVRNFLEGKFDGVNLADYVEARVRLKTLAGKTQFSLTIKGPGLESRLEREVKISAEEFDALMGGDFLVGTVEKGRERMVLDENAGLAAEIDVYRGRFHGLVVVEMEFDPKQSSPAEVEALIRGKFGDAFDVTALGILKNEKLATLEGGISELQNTLPEDVRDFAFSQVIQK